MQLPFAGIVPPLNENDSELPAGVTVPPQLVDADAGEATVTFAGSVFVNAAPVMAMPFEFVSVMLYVLTPPSGIDGGVKALVTVGGLMTVIVALPGTVFDPALLLVTEPAARVFVAGPAVVPSTDTVTVQVLFAGTVAPLRLTELAVVITVAPTHVDIAFGVADVAMPAGKVSVNAAPVTSIAFEFVSVMVSVDVPPIGMTLGVNALATPRPARMLRVSEAGRVFEPAFVVVTLPAASVFVYWPGAEPVTGIVIVQVLLAAIVPPLSCSDEAVGIVSVPPQLLVAMPLFVICDGYASVKASPVIAANEFGLVNVSVSVEVPLIGTPFGVNVFVTVGGASTLSVAVAGEALLPAFVDVTSPARSVFEYVPAVALVTSTVTVQLPFAGIVPPLSCSEPVVGSDTVPPHVVDAMPAFTTFIG